MDITKARKFVTNTLDDVEPNGEGMIATFRSSVNTSAVSIYANPDGTFSIGSSRTVDAKSFFDTADALQRAAFFVRRMGLTPRG